ncbi:hypothetical protein FKR81_13475 [Lentzea tibetensis]|uniref:P/Homo B domain-containing protein n=1 Tax=Lentzea tibetensis TaxID=2591470 RepID=A0A563EVY6_9PSEU|nr:proprotein convertase P-domain-containing protein [Lentzea tibetensis]TWP51856.1 hypothetical protein FKR81_13475 [Lentzea tibetensis]
MLTTIALLTALALPVPAPAGCGTHVNDRDAKIPDAGPPVVAEIVVSGCPGNAPADLKVAVLVRHEFRGDLRIDLVGPSGREFRLKNTNSLDGKDDVNETFTVNASGETGNGKWALKVQDRAEADVGHFDRWSLNLG